MKRRPMTRIVGVGVVGGASIELLRHFEWAEVSAVVAVIILLVVVAIVGAEFDWTTSSERANGAKESSRRRMRVGRGAKSDAVDGEPGEEEKPAA